MQIYSEPYDIDLVKTLKNIEQVINSNKVNAKQKSFGQKLVDTLYLYCRRNKINLKEHYKASISIIIRQDNPDYLRFLAITLIAYPTPRITSFLSYQKSQYKGAGYFPSFIEGYVYEYVQASSPFDNTERLDRIMKWVEGERVFVNSENKCFKSNWFEHINHEQLALIINKLVELKLLNADSNNIYIFQTNNFLDISKIKWLGTTRQLVFLVIKLSNNKPQYKGYDYPSIIEKFFVKRDGVSYQTKNIRTAYSQTRHFLHDNKYLPTSIQKIQDIIDLI
ncbi:MAG: hypothetical protein J0L87_12845 [Bacteroidetes bacterium]|nr:hypothetical protein [Bacteroidota bacterium]